MLLPSFFFSPASLPSMDVSMPSFFFLASFFFASMRFFSVTFFLDGCFRRE